MATISNLPKADFQLGLQLFERLPAFNDLLPCLDLSLGVPHSIDMFAPLKPISQPTLTLGVSSGQLRQAKPPACIDTPLTTYGARHVSLPDIGEDSFTASPTVRARPAVLPAISGGMAGPQSVKPKTKDVPPKQGSKFTGSHMLFQPPNAQTPSTNAPRGVAPQRMDAPPGREGRRSGNHALPVTRHAQIPQSVARAHPAISHAKVPYAQGPYYLAMAPVAPKAQYGVRV